MCLRLVISRALRDFRAAPVPLQMAGRVVLVVAVVAFLLAALVPARADASLRGVHPALAGKAREIARGCGATVVSGVRRTLIAGTRRLSLHASGRAVDLAGNPNCIYARLRGWPGGVTTDYGRVRHVHVSWGGHEHGRRFAHRHGGRLAHRSARGVRLASYRE
jgi:hypothetical protein